MGGHRKFLSEGVLPPGGEWESASSDEPTSSWTHLTQN
ncbi:hypothetical protein Pd630_LPD03851 [Rhodococcus opacus PD630]|nr:hypothetical protein Pd630_LPD03851 [Rhodococcus opacus PD630]